MPRCFLFVISVLCSTCGVWSASPAPAALFVVVGDQHSAYDRTAQVIAHVDRLKAENPGVPIAVLIDGDAFELGNAVAKRSHGAIEFAMLRALAQRAPTVLNLGNHEPEFFDVSETVVRVRATGAIVIGNVADHQNRRLFAPSSTHLNLGGHDVVIAGLTTDLLSQYRAAIRPTLDLANPVVWAKEQLPAILATAPVKIVLSHAGLKYDREILPLLPAGTLFAGAHDHQRFIHHAGKTVYFQSGSWNSHLSIVALRFDDAAPRWAVQTISLNAADPGDPALANLINATRAEYSNAQDTATIGRSGRTMDRTEAARFCVAAVRRATGVDAAFVGATTFGDGVREGNVSRASLDAWVRFDGTLWVAQVSGAQLRAWLAAANQGPDTPFDQRRDESLIADGPADVSVEKTYRIATTDWGVRNRARYFGSDLLEFVERPELRLKAVVTQALNE